MVLIIGLVVRDNIVLTRTPIYVLASEEFLMNVNSQLANATRKQRVYTVQDPDAHKDMRVEQEANAGPTAAP